MHDRRKFAGGVRPLVALALRRDRLMIPLWVLGIVVITVATVSSYRTMYPTLASRLEYGRAIKGSGALLALTGKPFDVTSIGGLVAWRTTSFNALLAGIMSLLLVIRHTRAEEESNRLELISSTTVGRLAPLTAAVVTALIANLAVALLTALGLLGLGQSVGGSLALGLAYAATGVVFTGIAAVSAQLTESARAASGIASALLGAGYLLRAIGDSTSASYLRWLSPIGWSEQLRPFAGERWWLLLPVLAATGALLLAGYLLAQRRDLGAGLLPQRPGTARATRWLGSSAALAWRLQRGSLAAWAAGFAVIGAVLGAIGSNIASLTDSSPQIRQLLKATGGPQGAVNAYFAAIMAVAGLAAAAYAVQAVSRLAGEENAERAEPLLATATSRIRWALGHLLVALCGTALLLATLGVSAGLMHGVRSGDLAGQLPRVAGAAIVQTPAAWAFAGLVLTLFGLAPRWTPVGWAAVVVSLVLNLLGSLTRVNHWLLDLSPFTHVPALPKDALDWTPLLWLLIVTGLLSATGLVGLNRRDLR